MGEARAVLVAGPEFEPVMLLLWICYWCDTMKCLLQRLRWGGHCWEEGQWKGPHERQHGGGARSSSRRKNRQDMEQFQVGGESWMWVTLGQRTI